MKYSDEDDNCYGVTGMAFGLTIWYAEDAFTHISIDADGLDCISFTSDYYFSGNPAISPKESWRVIFEHYRVVMGVLIANIMCRKLVREHTGVDEALRKRMLDILLEEGKSSCQLEEDEVENLFNKSFNYLSQLFSNNQIKRLSHDFAHELKARRIMTNHEVAEQLRLLRML